MRLLLLAVYLLIATGCSTAQCPEVAQISPPTASQAPDATRLRPIETANDAVCKRAYGVKCNEIIHLEGPQNAELNKITKACVRETVASYQNGEWIQDLKYQSEGGSRFGDFCIAISM